MSPALITLVLVIVAGIIVAIFSKGEGTPV